MLVKILSIYCIHILTILYIGYLLIYNYFEYQTIIQQSNIDKFLTIFSWPPTLYTKRAVAIDSVPVPWGPMADNHPDIPVFQEITHRKIKVSFVDFYFWYDGTNF